MKKYFIDITYLEKEIHIIKWIMLDISLYKGRDEITHAMMFNALQLINFTRINSTSHFGNNNFKMIHPLDPLSPKEIEQVVKLTKEIKKLSTRAKFMSLGMHHKKCSFFLTLFHLRISFIHRLI